VYDDVWRILMEGLSVEKKSPVAKGKLPKRRSRR
jgi:hypothetical protein